MLPVENERVEYKRELTDEDDFEQQVSLEQTLSFDKTRAVFAVHNLSLGEQQRQTLGLRRHDGLYTNLGLL